MELTHLAGVGKKTPSALLLVLLVVTWAGPGTRASAHSRSEALERAQEVRVQAWAAARGLKRKGAWLALGLRVEGERVQLLGLHGHEGSGAEAKDEEAERFPRTRTS